MDFPTCHFSLIFFCLCERKTSCTFIQSLKKTTKNQKQQKKQNTKNATTPHTQNTLSPFHSLLPMEKNRLYLIFQLEGRVADSFQWGGDFLPTFRTHPFPKIRPPGQAAQREQTQFWASAMPTSLPFPFTPSGLGMPQSLGNPHHQSVRGPARPGHGLALISHPPAPSSKRTAGVTVLHPKSNL